jgi:hypothetical protein
MKPAEGGCLCGAVRYRASGEAFHSTLCHCSSCRRAAGAPMVAWITVRDEEFVLTRGTPIRYRSSPAVVRTFCGACGTPLTYQHTSFPDEVDVTLASLDDPSASPPADHTWTSQKLPWLALGDDLPRFPRSRSDGASGRTSRKGPETGRS